MCTAYKIYAEVIRNGIEKEIIEKDMVPESQASFRRGRSTIDIFVLNNLMQRDKRQRGKEEYT